MLCFTFMLSGMFHVITDLHLDSKPVALDISDFIDFSEQ